MNLACKSSSNSEVWNILDATSTSRHIDVASFKTWHVLLQRCSSSRQSLEISKTKPEAVSLSPEVTTEASTQACVQRELSVSPSPCYSTADSVSELSEPQRAVQGHPVPPAGFQLRTSHARGASLIVFSASLVRRWRSKFTRTAQQRRF